MECRCLLIWILLFVSFLANGQVVVELDKSGYGLGGTQRINGVEYGFHLVDGNNNSSFIDDGEDYLNVEHPAIRQLDVDKYYKNISIYLQGEEFLCEVVNEKVLVLKPVEDSGKSIESALNIWKHIPEFSFLESKSQEMVEWEKWLSKSKENQYTFIYFWAPYCKPCTKTRNLLKKFAEKKVRLLCLVDDGSGESAVEMESYIADSAASGSIPSATRRKLNGNGFPTGILVDSKGKIVKYFKGIEGALNYIFLEF